MLKDGKECPNISKPRGRGYPEEGVTKGMAPNAIYDNRLRVETTNFMMKGHTGLHILSGIESSRSSQGLFNMIAHNIKMVVDKKPVAWNTA